MSDTLDISADARPDPATGGGHEVTTESVVESILFATDVPLPGSKIAQLLGTGDAGDVKRHINALNERYESAGASFRIESIAKGYQMLTLPAYNHWVSQVHKARADARLSPASLETLAIVAYKQPVLRAQIEAIRGVAVGDMLVRLREMNLVRIVGRAEEIGRPLLYGTTPKFLQVFGLGSLKDLPKIDEENPDAVPPLRPAPPDPPDDQPA
jgi:segregation and condensation protein B